MKTAKKEPLVAVLEKIFHEHRPTLYHYAWESEEERNREFVVCILIAGLAVDPAEARILVQVLGELNLLSGATIREDAASGKLLLDVLKRRGYSGRLCKQIALILKSVSDVIGRRWDNHLQRFLREYGEQMVADLAAILPPKQLSEPARRRVATLWLQNTANLPVLLPADQHIAMFCKQHGATSKDVEEAADRLGVNVAIVDDLLALHNEREVEERQAP